MMSSLCQGFLILIRSTSYKIMVGTWLTLSYLKLVQHFKPYLDNELNRMKETSLWQIFFIFYLALLIKYDNIDADLLKALLVVTFFANYLMYISHFVIRNIIEPLVDNRGKSPSRNDTKEGGTELPTKRLSDHENYGSQGDERSRLSSDVRSSSITMSPLFPHDSGT